MQKILIGLLYHEVEVWHREGSAWGQLLCTMEDNTIFWADKSPRFSAAAVKRIAVESRDFSQAPRIVIHLIV